MDRESLLQAIDQGPVRVHMYDGITFDIPDYKSCAIDSATANVLCRDEQAGRIKARWLLLVCMVRVERLARAA